MRRVLVGTYFIILAALVAAGVSLVRRPAVESSFTSLPSVPLPRWKSPMPELANGNRLPTPMVDADAHAVYVAAFAVLPTSGLPLTILVPEITTRPEVGEQMTVPHTHADWRPTADDFFEVNLQEWQLAPSLLSGLATIVPGRALQEVPPSSAVVKLSAVGFNPDRTRAILSVSVSSAKRFGWAQLAFERNAGHWNPVTVQGLERAFWTPLPQWR